MIRLTMFMLTCLCLVGVLAVAILQYQRHHSIKPPCFYKCEMI